jgi:hypothetical protein
MVGTAETDAMLCRPGTDRPSVIEYVLHPELTSFDATVGHSDRGAAGVPVTFRVFADERLAAEATVAFGETAEISAPVTGAVRLRLETVRAASTDQSGSVYPVWARARLVGGRQAVDAVLAESDL